MQINPIYAYLLEKEMATHSSILAQEIPWTQGTRVAGGEHNRASHHAPSIPSTLLPVRMMAFLLTPLLPK